MGLLTFALNVTLDGCCDHREGVANDEMLRYWTRLMDAAGAMLFGRVTYELFDGFWRHTVEDSTTAADPHRPGQRSREHRAIAIWLNEANKVVFSRTLKNATWRNSRLLHELNPDEIATMKQQSGKDMMVFGSGSIASQLTQHGLIDEYQFVVCPVLLGSGRPLLSGVTKTLKLDLLEVKKYPSGDVLLRYARA